MVYAAAILIVMGVSLFVAAPLFGPGLRFRRANRLDLEFDRLEHERALAVQGLRELEFDRQMSKISEADFTQLHASLEARALSAMAAIERLGADARSGKIASLKPRVSTSAAAAGDFCPQCGEKAAASARFCARCGGALRRKERA